MPCRSYQGIHSLSQLQVTRFIVSVQEFVIHLSSIGVTKVEFDMEAQKVFVESSLTSDELLATIKKTGRECSYVGVKK